MMMIWISGLLLAFLAVCASFLLGAAASLGWIGVRSTYRDRVRDRKLVSGLCGAISPNDHDLYCLRAIDHIGKHAWQVPDSAFVGVRRPF